MSGARAPAPRVAVVAGTPQLVRAARALGVETVLAGEDAGGSGAVDVEVDPADHAALVEALRPLHERAPFARILSLTEHGLLPAAVAADALGVEGNGVDAVRMLGDKALMRDRLAADPALAVLAQRAASPEEVDAVRRQAGGHAVVKPVDGVGSAGVHYVDTPDEVWHALMALRAEGHVEVLVEELLDGPELSIEAFSVGGRHTVHAITEKLVLDNAVEIGHVMPAAVEADRAAIEAVVVAFLDAVGLREGPSHTEVKLTRRGPRLIEGHNRVGGDRIRTLLQRAYGLDVVGDTVAVPLGLRPPAPRRPAQAAAAIRFLAPEPGRVRDVAVPALPEDVEAHLDVEVGDLVGPVQQSADRSGYVLAAAPDRASALALVDGVVEAITIDTAPPATCA